MSVQNILKPDTQEQEWSKLYVNSVNSDEVITNNISITGNDPLNVFDLSVDNLLTVNTATDIKGNNYATPDLGSPNYSLHTDGLGSTFWAPDDTGSGGISFNGILPTTDGELLACSGIDGQTAKNTGLFITPSELQLGLLSLQCLNCNVTSVLNTNVIEPTSTPFVRIEEVRIEDKGIKCDTIDEITANNGVNIEGVLLKDGRAEFGAGGGNNYKLPSSSFGANNNDVLVFDFASKNFNFKSTVCTTFQYGGNVNTVGDFIVPQGDPNLATNNTLDATKEVVIPVACSLKSISYSTSSGDATSTLGIWKSGFNITTANLTGAQGVFNLPVAVTLFSGDRLAISLNSGSVIGSSNLLLFCSF